MPTIDSLNRVKRSWAPTDHLSSFETGLANPASRCGDRLSESWRQSSGEIETSSDPGLRLPSARTRKR
jgi:hypothetical protein